MLRRFFNNKHITWLLFKKRMITYCIQIIMNDIPRTERGRDNENY